MDREERRKKFDAEHGIEQKPDGRKKTPTPEQEARYMQMVEYRIRGRSLQSIANEFGLSRERIRQITSRASLEQQLLFHREKKPLIEKTCAQCGKSVFVSRNRADRNATGKFFCNETHKFEYIAAHKIQDVKAYQRNRQRERYHGDPVWKAKFQAMQNASRRRRLERAKNDPVLAEHLRIQQKKNSEKWLLKKQKEDPAYFERRKYRNLSREKKDLVLLKSKNWHGRKRNTERKPFEDAYRALHGDRKTQTHSCKHMEFTILGLDTIATTPPVDKKVWVHIHKCPEITVFQRFKTNKRIYIFP